MTATSALLEVAGLGAAVRGPAGEVAVVDEVEFTVPEGGALGLVGESGCGKTMTALALMGLLPAGGRLLPGSSIRFRGEELVGPGGHSLGAFRGRHIGMIFQEPGTALNPVLRVGEQVAEGVRHHLGMGRRAARARAVELLREVGIPGAADRARSYPHELSGGMRQRVVIAAALACEPDLLVADEPTTALDATVRAQILDLLARLRESRGLALLLITHDLGSVARVCERVAVMYAGHLVEVGPTADVLRAPAHPYTRGLLDSLPRVDDPGAPLRSIAGVVPRAGSHPTGCRFADRCAHAWDRCRAEAPPMLHAPPGGLGGLDTGSVPPTSGSSTVAGRASSGGSGRLSRCWLVDEGEPPPEDRSP